MSKRFVVNSASGVKGDFDIYESRNPKETLPETMAKAKWMREIPNIGVWIEEEGKHAHIPDPMIRRETG